MTRILLIFIAALALTGPASAAQRRTARPPAPQPPPVVTVSDILARTRADDGPLLRELVGAPVAASDYASARAAIRACHAERYATARENVLSGRNAPLRDC